MKVGTKSVLFGAHCFFIHPLFVFIAWWKLFGFPYDIRLWVAFFVHDLGYWGKPNMDGKEGETHVELGAKIMHALFDWKFLNTFYDLDTGKPIKVYYSVWGNFSLYHSRFYAKKDDANYSKLCVADKYSICLEPYWLYLPRVILSGEIKEYMRRSGEKSKFKGEPINKYEHMKLCTETKRGWFYAMTSYLCRWVNEHKDMKEDKWTPEQ
ncbi:hypothetical protein EZS27_003909 [termite gut metagenome]|uniref:HD domain-containing protein n=1 Tax=termite gut metagenome TaxID=433724 RepID=A0A5J4SRE9_9ZZZZ